MSMAKVSLDTVPQPHVLTIAGSDSGGGAGIQADLKTISAFQCYGSSVITALTAQNTLGVQGVHIVPPEFVIEQLKSIFDDDMRPDAIKFGMLAGAPTIKALAEFFAALPADQVPFLVLDPVMVSTSGHTLLSADAATGELVSRLLPLVHLVTPNVPEALTLCEYGQPIETLEDMLGLAAAVRAKTGVAGVLLKGGHVALQRADVLATARAQALSVSWDNDADGDDIEVITDFCGTTLGLQRAAEVIVDVLVTDRVHLFVGPKIESASTHGTGCTLSAALASVYAIERRKGNTSKTLGDAATQRAIQYTQSAIASAHPLGRGHGPLNHMHLTFPRALPPPTASNPTPFVSYLIRSCPDLWRQYVRHPFVQQVGTGTLPRECFEHYIKQDYHYLKHYARAHALGAYKADTFDVVTAFSEIALHVARESKMHVGFCEEFGITRAQLEATPEAAACSAYARYVVDVGTQGDVLDVYMAVASCLIGYGEVGLWLKRRLATGEATLDNNPYARWVTDYAGEEFLGAVRRGIANLEARVAADPPTSERLARLTTIWTECVRLERNFWQMAMDLAE